MDFLLVLTFTLVAIVSFIYFLLYIILKKLGYPKLGKILSFIFLLLITGIIGYEIFKDEFFTKNNVKEFLAEQNIILKEDFRILKNESHSSIGDYYHTFTLSISSGDQQRIIQQIKSSENYKTQKDSVNYFIYLNRLDKKIIQNYETNNSYVREYLQSNGKGYTPTFRRISIQKTKNELVFEDIDE